jgi:hypothetical protein
VGLRFKVYPFVENYFGMGKLPRQINMLKALFILFMWGAPIVTSIKWLFGQLPKKLFLFFVFLGCKESF